MQQTLECRAWTTYWVSLHRRHLLTPVWTAPFKIIFLINQVSPAPPSPMYKMLFRRAHCVVLKHLQSRDLTLFFITVYHRGWKTRPGWADVRGEPGRSSIQENSCPLRATKRAVKWMASKKMEGLLKALLEKNVCAGPLLRHRVHPLRPPEDAPEHIQAP